jgi:hypothetical protein
LVAETVLEVVSFFCIRLFVACLKGSFTLDAESIRL